VPRVAGYDFRRQPLRSFAREWKTESPGGVVWPGNLCNDQKRYWDSIFSTLSRLPEWKQSIDSEHVQNTYLDSRGTRELMDEQNKSMRSILADLQLVK
jgi:tripartite-type tricarboxylate transporter receptor subunit TctC